MHWDGQWPKMTNINYSIYSVLWWLFYNKCCLIGSKMCWKDFLHIVVTHISFAYFFLRLISSWSSFLLFFLLTPWFQPTRHFLVQNICSYLRSSLSQNMVNDQVYHTNLSVKMISTSHCIFLRAFKIIITKLIIHTKEK